MSRGATMTRLNILLIVFSYVCVSSAHASQQYDELTSEDNAGGSVVNTPNCKLMTSGDNNEYTIETPNGLHCYGQGSGWQEGNMKIDVANDHVVDEQKSADAGYAALNQTALAYQEGIYFFMNVRKNRQASPDKWIRNASTIFSKVKAIQHYYNEHYQQIRKNKNHEIMFKVSQFAVIYSQWVLYAIREIFKSIEVIIMDSMAQRLESVLTYLRYGYTIARFVELHYLIELVEYAVRLSYTFAGKYYDYSRIENPSVVSAITLFSEPISYIENICATWFRYIRGIHGLDNTFKNIAESFINVIEILFHTLDRFISQNDTFIEATTLEFYTATLYLHQSGDLIQAYKFCSNGLNDSDRPKILENPSLLNNATYKSIYCFLVSDEINVLATYVGKFVVFFDEESAKTWIFKESYNHLMEGVTDVIVPCNKQSGGGYEIQPL